MRHFSPACLYAVGFVLCLAGPAMGGGGWVSGGGDLISEEDNPWFLANQPVNYCINIDEQNMGVTRNQAVACVKAALKFWHDQFANAIPFPDLASDDFLEDPLKYRDVKGKISDALDFSKMGFTEIPCSQKPELRFQLGTLDGEERDYVVKSRPRVAVSVRQDYDANTLRARGFVYVAPPSGPLSFRKRPGHQNEKSNPWVDHQNRRLVLALVHEMGHVFGLVHQGDSVMKAEFLTSLVRGKPFQKLPSLEAAFNQVIFPNHSAQIFQVCAQNLSSQKGALKVFDSLRGKLGAKTSNCLKVKYVIDGLQEKAEFWAGSDTGDTKDLLVGRTAGDGFGNDLLDDIEEPEFLVFLTLPEKQTFFRGLPVDLTPSIGAYAMRTLESRKGVVPEDSKLAQFALLFDIASATLRLRMEGAEKEELELPLLRLEPLKNSR